MPNRFHWCSIPFFTTKEMGKGAGIGAAMNYGIAEQN